MDSIQQLSAYLDNGGDLATLPDDLLAILNALMDEHGTAPNVVPINSSDALITADFLLAVLPRDVKDRGLFYKAKSGLVRRTSMHDFLRLLNSNLRKYEIVEPLQVAAFLAQCLHECDFLRTNEEYRSRFWARYEGGKRYHGRGLIQLTHKRNYRAYSRFLGKGNYLVDQPEVVANDLDFSIGASCWYWRHGSAWGDINKMSKNNDFLAVTMAVNGGFNGWLERKQTFQNLVAEMKLNVQVEHYRLEDSWLSRTRNGSRIYKKYFKKRAFV